MLSWLKNEVLLGGSNLVLVKKLLGVSVRGSNSVWVKNC